MRRRRRRRQPKASMENESKELFQGCVTVGIAITLVGWWVDTSVYFQSNYDVTSYRQSLDMLESTTLMHAHTCTHMHTHMHTQPHRGAIIVSNDSLKETCGDMKIWCVHACMRVCMCVWAGACGCTSWLT